MHTASSPEMAPRNFSQTRTAIWDRDSDFRELPSGPQRTFWLLFSQPDISACGVLAYRPGRWGTYAPDTNRASIEADIKELQRRRYVVVDDETDELWVRSFMKWDNFGYRNAKRLAAIRQDRSMVASASITQMIDHELDRLLSTSITSAERSEPQVDSLFDSLPDRGRVAIARNPNPNQQQQPKAFKKLDRKTTRPSDVLGTDQDPDFVAFWSAYPRKISKGHARKAWARAVTRGVDPAVIIAAAVAFASDPDRIRKGSDFTAHPATWLNGERWNDQDERIAAQGKSTTDQRLSETMDLVERLRREEQRELEAGR